MAAAFRIPVADPRFARADAFALATARSRRPLAEAARN
jgi:hypothetical protein